MLERARRGDVDVDIDEEHREDIEPRGPLPGKRVRAELYAVATGRVQRSSTGVPGKRARVARDESWLPPPGTLAADRAWPRLVSRTIVDAVAPWVSRARIAASTSDATVQSEIRAGGAAHANAEQAVRVAGDNGHALPDDLRDRMSRVLGHTFAHVRIHVDSAAATAADSLGARAFTLGSHIYFADGAYAPGTLAGDRLLRHELTHVAQYDRGLLRGGGRGLEVAEHDSATEVEARAAEELREPAPRAPVPHATPPATAAPPTAPAAGPAVRGPASGGPGAAASAPPAPTVAARTAAPTGPAPAAPATAAPTSGVASPISLGGALIDVVRVVSPRLASLIEHGVDGQVTDILNSAVQAGLKSLVPHNPLAGLTNVGVSIGEICQTLAGAAQGDAKCCETFKHWCEKLGELAKKGSTSKFIQDFKKGFDEVDHFVGAVVKFFAGGLLDSLRDDLNDLKALGGFVADAVTKVGNKLKAAADFALKALGLPSVEKIQTWLTDKAAKLWEKVKSLAGPALRALEAVGKALFELSGLGAIVDAFKFAGELIEVTKWLIAHRADEDIIRHAHAEMAHTFLPKLLDSMGGLVGKVQAAVAWLENHMTIVVGVLVAAAAVLIGPLAILAVVVVGLIAAVKALWAVIGPKLTALWNDLKALVVKAYNYAKPVIDTLTQIAFVITNPWMAPIVIASSAWLLLPECFKGPLINLFLDLIIALLQAMPNAVLLFGPLWRFVRVAAIGFFTTVRTTWSDPDKVKAIDRLAHLGSGRSTEMMAGFVVGVFKGLVYGVIDPFKMVYELLKVGFDLSEFFAKLAAHAPAVAAVIKKYLPQLQTYAAQILSAGKAALDDFMSGKIGFDQLWAMLAHFMDTIETKAASIGVSAAGKLKGWILGGISDWDIGETIGIAVGYIVVFLLIAYFSAGVSAEAEGALAVVRSIAKILNAPYELMGAALKPLTTMFKPLLSALMSVGERLGLKAIWQGAMRAVEGLASVLGRLVEELILAVEGKLAERAAAKLLAALTEKLGAELAEKLIEELGEKAAQELVDKLGADLVAKLGASLEPAAIKELADKLGKDLIEKLLEQGLDAAAISKLADKAGKELIEKLLEMGLSAKQIDALVEKFGKEGVELLLEEKLTADELNRLSDLGEPALRKLMLGLDGKQVLALEEALGKDALEKLADKLDGPALQELVDKLGADNLKKLAEMDLTAEELQRLAKLFERDGTEMLLADGITGPEMRRLLALEEGTLRKLLADLDVNKVLELEAKLGKNALDRAAEGLSGTEIETWVADLGEAKVKELAEKYGGKSMKFYGEDFFRNYKGITPGCANHATTAVDGATQAGGVSGCHDYDVFMNTYVNPTPPRVFIRTTTVNGQLEEFEYSMMKADGTGPKAGTHTKTTMHGLAGQWPALEPELTAALEKQIADTTFDVTPNRLHEVAISTGTWGYYYSNGEITSIFPML